MADMKQASRGPRDGLSPASIALVRLTWAALMSTASLTHTDVLIPPQSAADDHSDWLRSATAFGRRDDPSSLSYRMWGAGDTNVLPLLEADNEPLSPKLHPRSTSRFLSHSAIVRQLHYRDWRLTRGWANVSYLHGNGDAGQLWLDLASDTQRPGVRSTPYLEGRETKLAWWGLSRRFSVSSPKLGDVALHGRVGLRLLEAFRHREAAVSGWYENNQFQGKLSLLSTRGAGFSTTGHGYSLDLDLCAVASPRCTVGLRTEGLLGRLKWGQVRLLEADINSANVFQDPQGFIHNLPLATGTEQRFMHADSLTTLWQLGASWEEGNGYWTGIVSSQGTPTTYRLSRVQRIGRDQYLMGTWWLNRDTLGLTYWNRYLTVSVASSDVSLSDSFVGSVGVAVRLPWHPTQP